MLKVGIILGSTRPGRKGEVIAKWIHALASTRGDAAYEYVDIAEYALPLLDEPAPPAMGQYTKEHTKKWSAKIASLDAFVFVSPEYNHSMSAALKNAIDFLYREWNNKAAGFVGYGMGAGGSRGVEQLRLVMGELQVADVRAGVFVSLLNHFEKFTVFKPQPHQEKQVHAMLDQIVAWGGALRPLRVK